MEALEVIKTILDLSQKRTEYSEEVEALRMTVKSLQRILVSLEDSVYLSHLY